MEINNPATGEVLLTYCTGPGTSCYCHSMAVTFGVTNGLCVECGCPKNLEGFEYYKKRYPERIKTT